MNKNTTPIIIIAAVVILGGGALWYSTQNPAAPSPAPEVAPVPDLATTSAPSAPQAGASGGSGIPQVAGQTVWGDVNAPTWKIGLKYERSWKLSGIQDAEKKLYQLSMGGDTIQVFVSRDAKLAEPSKLAYTTVAKTVAGTSVSMHVYEKPNATDAYYWYFSLPAGGDTYYFRIDSTVSSTKLPDDFIGFITKK